jgi:hypothetical protein
MSLRPTSIENEYYCGALPGILQYSMSSDELKNLEIPNNTDTRGFVIAEHTLENKLRIIPDTETGNKNDWKLIFCMRKETDDGEVWLKAALLNTTTQNIALITSTNSLDNLTKRGNRGIKSHDPNWYIGHYRMSAPSVFWRELVNRITI